MSYSTWLNAIVKSQPIYVIEFAGIADRFVTKDFPGLASAANPYADVQLSSTHRVQIIKAQADAGSASFTLVDADEEVHAFLNTNEKRLKDVLVTIKVGAETLDETADFLSTYWFLRNYTQNADGGWDFELLDVFNQLDRPIWSDIEKPHLKPASRIGHLDTSIRPAELPIGWREPGYALLADDQKNVELIEYQSIDPLTGTLQAITRQKHGVGKGNVVYAADTSEIIHVGVKYGTPKQIMLELALTTEDGSGPAPYDLGNGDGAGIPDTAINVTAIENSFDDTNHGVHDWTLLFIEEKSISVKDFIEKWILVPTSFSESVNGSGQLIVVPFEIFPSATTSLAGYFDKNGPFNWDRDFRTYYNVFEGKYDFHAGDDEEKTKSTTIINQSVIRYKRSEPFEIEGRGFRGANGTQYGYPDLNGDSYMETASVRLAEIYGTPAPKVKVKAALRFRDVPPGEGVKLTHPEFPDPVDSATRGVTDKILTVLSKKIDLKGGRPWPVELSCEARGNIGRPWKWGPDANPATYDAASESQKDESAYWSDDVTCEPGSDDHLGYYWAHEEEV